MGEGALMEFFSARKSDLILVLVTLCLVTFGTAMIYSSSFIMASSMKGDGYYFLKRQLGFFAAGLGLMYFFSRVHYERLRKFAYPALGLAVVLLIALMIPGIGVRKNGATRWLNLGFFAFQVAEFAKVAVILFLAHYLSRNEQHLRDLKRGFLIPLGIAGVVMALVIKQPDFGTMVIIGVILMSMLCLAGTRMLHISALVAVAVPAAVWMVLSNPYRMKRILSFRNPWDSARDSGFQIIQSWLSFGSGGPFGVGLGDGMQKLFYLPEPHTDFILSVVAEEAGFIGVAAVIALFCIFVVKGFIIAFKKQDTFGTLLACGITMLIGLEAIINIAVVLGVIPTKGLALPFMSYGGSSLVMSMICVGILLNISTSSEDRVTARRAKA